MTDEQFDQGLFIEMQQVMKTKFKMVLDEYESDVKSYIRNIDVAVANRNLKNIAAYAHPLKSSSMALGFIGLGRIAMDMEVTAKTSINEGEQNFPNTLIDLSAMLKPAYSYVHGIIKDYKGH